MDSLSGNVAVVTGAGSGIGRAAAVSLARAGARIIAADIDMGGAEATAAQIAAAGGTAFPVHADVSSDTCFETLKTATLDRFGRVDIVMNNAGVLMRGLPEQVPLDEWKRVLDVNLLSVVRSNLVFIPHFIAQRSGHIVNTASFAGLYTYAFDRLPYAASKAAVVQISEGLAIYLRPFGVGVTVLCPGPVLTNITANVRVFGEPTETRGPGADFELLDPATVGDQVVDAIRAGRFMLPTHPHVTDRLMRRAGDWDAFIADQIGRPHIVKKAAP